MINIRLSLCLILFALTACAPKNVQELTWKTNSVIDTQLPKLYNSETKLAYELANDNDHLYLKVFISDQITQQQIMLSGMQVWFDTTKRFREQFGLLYPLGRHKAKGNRSNPQNKRPSFEDMKEQYLLNQDQFKSENLNNFEDGIHPLGHHNELIFQLTFDRNGALIYNAKIPLTCFYIKDLSVIEATDIYSLTIKIPGIELPSGPPGGQSPNGGSRSPQGGRGGPPRGRAGQDGPTGRSNLTEMTNDRILKLRFKPSLPQ